MHQTKTERITHKINDSINSESTDSLSATTTVKNTDKHTDCVNDYDADSLLYARDIVRRILTTDPYILRKYIFKDVEVPVDDIRYHLLVTYGLTFLAQYFEMYDKHTVSVGDIVTVSYAKGNDYLVYVTQIDAQTKTFTGLYIPTMTKMKHMHDMYEAIPTGKHIDMQTLQLLFCHADIASPDDIKIKTKIVVPNCYKLNDCVYNCDVCDLNTTRIESEYITLSELIANNK